MGVGRDQAGRTRGRGAARPTARWTGRPARHLPGAVSQARRLTEPETLEALRLTPDQVAFLDRCADGFPPRNALAAITALKLKLDFTQRKPKTEVDVTGKLTLEQLVTQSLAKPEADE